MAYIGNTAQNQAFTPRVDYFSGNGSTVAFTLSFPVASVAQVQATIENVPQNPSDAFTVSGNTITFTSAPPSGTNNIYVYYTSPITTVIQPGQGTVGTTQLVDGAVTQAKLAAGAGSQWTTTGSNIYYNTGNVGIGTASPAAKLHVSNTSGSIQARVSSDTDVSVAAIASGVDSSAFMTVINDARQWTMRVQGVENDQFQIRDSTAGATRMTLDSSGNLGFDSGYGSSAVAYGCRAWVNFNGTGTVAIRASGNVSSITDNGTGSYAVNFTTAMPDVNYCYQFSADDSASNQPIISQNGTATTSAMGFRTFAGTSALADFTEVCVSVFR